MRNKLKNKKGFTLVEMIVVLAIIAILIALLAPNVARLIRSSQITSDDAKVKTIASAAQVYGTDQIRRGASFTTTPAGADFSPIVISSGPNGDAALRGTNATPSTPWSIQGPVFIDGTGNAYLTENTLRGTESCLLYISNEGAVIGAVYYTGTQIKSVTGIYPATGTITFTTEALRNTATIAPATGVITMPTPPSP